MSSSAAVFDKHAELLKMVNQCTHYKCTSLLEPRQKKKKFFLLTFFCLSSSSHSGALVLHALLHGFD
jgi:hypothetical protein